MVLIVKVALETLNCHSTCNRQAGVVVSSILKYYSVKEVGGKVYLLEHLTYFRLKG